MTNNTAITPKVPQETPYKFNKRIGTTNYIVSVNFSKTSRENINDKILRLIKNEISSGKAVSK